jgi:hypothetical protein
VRTDELGEYPIILLVEQILIQVPRYVEADPLFGRFPGGKVHRLKN